jgi:hypothetical protein
MNNYGAVIADCNNPPVVQWCNWDWGKPMLNCQPLINPNAPNPENPGMTHLQVCNAIGKVYNSEALCIEGGTGEGQVKFCNWKWGSDVDCHPIADGMNVDNPTMTNLETCEAFSKVYDSEAQCIAGGSGAGQVEWCDWGWGKQTHDCHPMTNPNAIDPTNAPMTQYEVCVEWHMAYPNQAACIAGAGGGFTGSSCDWGGPGTNPCGKNCWENKSQAEVDHCLANGGTLVTNCCP